MKTPPTVLVLAASTVGLSGKDQMLIELTTIKGMKSLVNYPDFRTTLTEDEQFQQFLSHFKVSGSMITVAGDAVLYHSVESVRVVKEGN